MELLLFSPFPFLRPLFIFPLFFTFGQFANSPPNLLFILADDLGFADFDWLDPSLRTPNLRQLAFSPHSALLSHVYVGPLCSPTRSAMLSGLYPFRIGTQDGVFLHSDSGGLSPSIPLLPQILRHRFAYRTHLVGKWHLGYCRPQFLPTNRGFDTFYGYYGPQGGYFNHSADLLDHRAFGNRGILLRGLDLFREGNGHSQADWAAQGIHSTELFVDEAIRVISSSSPDRPFFLLLSFQAVHAPLEVPSKWVALCPPHLPPNRRLYCGMLAGMDQAIGKLMAHLRAIGQFDKTLIVFGTDNGGDPKFGASNWPLRGGKGQLWEGGTRSQAILHWTNKIRPGIRNDLFHAVDWPATLLGAAGLGIDRFGDGLNQWAMLSGMGNGKRRHELIYAAQTADGKGEAAIRDDHFKLIFRPPPAHPLLFHLGNDPQESRDLSLQMPWEVRRLAGKLAGQAAGPRMPNAFRMRTDPRGWPQKHKGTFGGNWC